MALSEIINQMRAREQLLMGLRSRRLPNAFLFSGPRGVGKTLTALILARILNCERMEFDSCDSCTSCERAKRFQHPEIEFVFPIPSWPNEAERASLRVDALTRKAEEPFSQITFQKKTSISINEIKLLIRSSSTRILHGKWRVFVISQAEKMTEDASNSFLKLLEEPRENTLIILIASKPQLLLPTVLSRCQEVRFSPLTEEDIEKVLAEQFSLPSPRAHLVASLSQGSLGKALELKDEKVFEERKASFDFLAHSLRKEVVPLLGEIERISYEKDYHFVERILENLLLFHRDLLFFRNGGKKESLANRDMLDLIEEECRKVTVKELGRRTSIFLKGLEAIERNVDPGLILHEVSYRLSGIEVEA